ncbi:MAG: glycosyltransferase family 4 protein [Methanothrix sp.]|jgi:glycosyltransferase involved in cell wall biosynthesis
MKICLISNLYEPYILGGAENYVGRIARGLSEHDEVIVITTCPGLKSLTVNEGKIRIYRFTPFNIYHTYHAKQVKEYVKPLWHLLDFWNPHTYLIAKDILKNENPDIVHLNNLGGLSLSVISALRVLKLPHIYTIHDFSLLCPRATLLHAYGKICEHKNPFCRSYGCIKRNLSGSPDIVTAPSQFVLEMHLRNGFFKQSKVVKMPLGIVLPEDKVRKRLHGSISILYVGQVSLHKGVDILIDAFKCIISDCIKLDIVGKGPDMEDLLQKASDDRRIKFHGFVSSEELAEIFRNTDLLVVPSVWYDNSPMVIYEALSYGVPVLASRIGGIPELILNGYNGVLFDAGDRDQLRSTLKKLVLNRSELERMSKNAQESSIKYGMKEHLTQLRSLYREAMDR